MIRVLVFGGRDWYEQRGIYVQLDELHAEHGHEMIVIHGGARGADSVAQQWCEDRFVHSAVVTPFWYKHEKPDRSAGMMRNAAMRLLEPHIAIAAPGGNGTADMKRRLGGIELIDVK